MFHGQSKFCNRSTTKVFNCVFKDSFLNIYGTFVKCLFDGDGDRGNAYFCVWTHTIVYWHLNH